MIITYKQFFSNITRTINKIFCMAAQLKVLFLTDIHLSFKNVQKLGQWFIQTKLAFDVILIGGDTANCDQNGNTHNQEQQLGEADEILTQIQQIFNCKIYFIPGNHDPLVHYTPGHLVSADIVSVHQRRVKLAEDLELVGFGGSVPAYFDKEATKQIWKGYPFDSNEALTKYCQEKKLFTDQPNNDIQRIYLTHCGPFDYQTSINRFQHQTPIYGGAKYFNKLIEHENLLLYLHGHVHEGSRFVKVNQVPIINPGNLSGGEFGYFVIVKDEKIKRWRLTEKHFMQL